MPRQCVSTLGAGWDVAWLSQEDRALDRFVEEIRGTGPTVCPVDDAVLATRVAFAAVKSVQEHRIVDMEEA